MDRESLQDEYVKLTLILHYMRVIVQKAQRHTHLLLPDLLKLPGFGEMKRLGYKIEWEAVALRYVLDYIHGDPLLFSTSRKGIEEEIEKVRRDKAALMKGNDDLVSDIFGHPLRLWRPPGREFIELYHLLMGDVWERILIRESLLEQSKRTRGRWSLGDKRGDFIKE